jgi:hypothetical protein
VVFPLSSMAIESKMRRPSFPSFDRGDGSSKRRIWMIILFIFILIVIGIGAWIFLLEKGIEEKNIFTGDTSSESQYQAVFLDNGQVYFGHIVYKNEDFYRLSNVYYLQFRQNPQSGDSNSVSDSDFSLIKLGNEIHAPKDYMDINKEHILFMEDLKDDSKITQAIAAYLQKKDRE